MNPSKLVFDLRTSKKISQKTLARGILSVPVLSRFEQGTKTLPYQIIEALIQRLGKSVDSFDLHMSNRDYEALFLRQMLGNTLLEDIEEHKVLCDRYESLYAAEHSLHKQFVQMMKACALQVDTGKNEECTALLEESLSVTFKEWTEPSWAPYLLCTQEIQIVFMLIYIYQRIGHLTDAARLLDCLKEKICVSITDEEEHAKLYPLWCFLNAENAVHEKSRKKIQHFIAEGRRSLTDNGQLSFMVEFLELELRYGKDNKTTRRELHALRHAESLAGFRHSKITFPQFVLLGRQREIIITNEMIRATRSFLGLSQEVLGEGILEPESISRIESGRRTPHPRKTEHLYQRLGLDQVPLQALETDDFHLVERERDFSRCIFRGDYRNAEQIFEEIKSKLDMTHAVNQQFVKMNQIMLHRVNNNTKTQKEVKETIGELYALLRLTFLHFQGKVYRTPTRNEFHILIEIAIQSRLCDDEKASKDIYRALINHYSSSIVEEEHHAREWALLYLNYASLLSREGAHHEATEFARRGMILSFRIRRGDWASLFLGTMAVSYSQANRTVQDPFFIRTIRTAYWMMMLYHQTTDAEQTHHYVPDIIDADDYE